MVIVMEHNANDQQVEAVVKKLVSQGFDVHRSTGVECTILGAVGANVVDSRDYTLLDGVHEVHRITQPYKLASRAFRPEGSVIRVKGSGANPPAEVEIGGHEVVVMAGPCTIENFENCDLVANRVKAAGGRFIRGGAFKPRTAPYSFQGHGV